MYFLHLGSDFKQNISILLKGIPAKTGCLFFYTIADLNIPLKMDMFVLLKLNLF